MADEGAKAETPMSYGEYLRVTELISMQNGRGPDDPPGGEEIHFIVVHQIYELWFRLILSEIRYARNLLAPEIVPEPNIQAAVHHFKRISEILRLMMVQWRVVETLSPQDFLAFRHRLGSASGFESVQMREIEQLLGYSTSKRTDEFDPASHIRRLGTTKKGAEDLERYLNTCKEKTLPEVLSQWLYRTPVRGSKPVDERDQEIVHGFVIEYLDVMDKVGQRGIESTLSGKSAASSEALLQRHTRSIEGAREFLLPGGNVDRSRVGLLFIESYRRLPLLAWPRALVDSIVEVEEAMLLWRNAHVRMVERVIGRRVGTGGSSGVDYLDATLKMRAFHDLWTVRSILISEDDLPEIEDLTPYGFEADA